MNSSTPIIPILVKDPLEAVAMSKRLLQEGVFIQAIRPPTVPEGSSRLRISVSAVHTAEDLDRLVTVLGAGVLLAGVTGVVVWRGRSERPWLVGWLWYLATLLPVIGLVQVGGQSLADRYTYVPLMGVFIMVVWGWPKGMMARRMGRMAAAVLAAAVLCGCARVICRHF